MQTQIKPPDKPPEIDFTEHVIPSAWEVPGAAVEALVGEKLTFEAKPYNLLLSGALGRQGSSVAVSLGVCIVLRKLSGVRRCGRRS